MIRHQLLKPLLRRLPAASVVLFATTWTLTCSGATAATPDPLQKAAALLRNNQPQEALQGALSLPSDGPRNLLAGEAALRLKRYAEAVRYAAEAERGYPLLADIAASIKADALYGAKQYREAAAAANAAAGTTQNPVLSRRMEKLAADALFASGDLKGALAAYRQFVTRHTLGKDAVEALQQTAVCQEGTGDRAGAVLTYRTVYLQFPSSTAAPKALERLKALEKAGVAQAAVFTPEEQFKRGQLLLANNQPGAAAWVFSSIPQSGISGDLTARIELKSGQAAVRQRHYLLAEQFLKRAVTARSPATRNEARLLLARLEIRQGNTEAALARLLALAAEKGPLADDALLEAALVHKQSGRFADAAQLLQRLTREYPASDLASRAGWELAWGHYQTGNLPAAADAMKRLFADNYYRERALYWLARIQERQNRAGEAERNYRQLMHDFPFGFYAAWYRSRYRVPSGWMPVPPGLPELALPSGSQRVQALAALGMAEKARSELTLIKPKANSRDAVQGYARLQQLAGDQNGAIVTFQQNRPATIERGNLAFWMIGFPRPYAALFSRHSTTNGIPDGLVYALAKAESGFRAEVKSSAGAIGLMQLMPATARLTSGLKGKNFTPQLLIDPEFNIKTGTKHLRDLFNQFHQDTVYTLAAYNAGAGAVNRWRKTFGDLPRDEFVENIPYRETRDYVKKIVADYAVYRALYLMN